MRLLIIAAVVMAIFAIIATAFGSFLDVTWDTWISASLLAYFLEVWTGWTAPMPVARQRVVTTQT